MSTSAPRLGLEAEDNLEMEVRLRRIETELATKANVGDFADEAAASTARADIIPQVSGLRVSGSTPGAITVAWNAVPISNLKRYELDVAEDLAFATNAETKNVQGTEYTYTTNSDTGGGGDTTIYIRIRARASNSNVGAYSATLNTTTGQAQTEDIADDAVDNSKVDNSVIVQLALREYITPRGFHMSNATKDTVNDSLTVTRGVARGEADDGTINLAADVIKDITATWAAGNNVGGFPTTALTLTDGTDYLVFAIDKSDGSAGDVGYDTSATAANLIAEAKLVDSGFTGALYRQIGVVSYVSAAVGIRAFISPTRQPERFIWNDGAIVDQNMLEDPATQTGTMDCPANVTAIYGLSWKAGKEGGPDTNHMWVRSTAQTAIHDEAPSITNFTHRQVESDDDSDTYFWADQEVEVDSSSQYNLRVSTTDNDNLIRLFTMGFIFIR